MRPKEGGVAWCGREINGGNFLVVVAGDENEVFERFVVVGLRGLKNDPIRKKEGEEREKEVNGGEGKKRAFP